MNMNQTWQHILRTVMAGTDRYPVSDDDLSALGLPTDTANSTLETQHSKLPTDAAHTALRALPAAYVLQRAAAPLGRAPEGMPSPAAPDKRPICPPAAAQPLAAMLRYEAYPAVLPEYFDLLARRGWRLPPELMPEVLDHLVQKKGFTPAVRAALGPLGAWLAAQNPAWRGFFPKKNAGKRSISTLPVPQPSAKLELRWNELPVALWHRCVLDLAQRDAVLENPDSALVGTLLHAVHSWSKPLLHHVVEYPLRTGRVRTWVPPKHLRALLQRAALRCRPSDVLGLAPPDRDWPYAWHSELVQFRGTVQFRQRMWEAFGA